MKRLAALLACAAFATGCLDETRVNLRPVAIASETFSVALKGLQGQFVTWADADPAFRPTEQRWQLHFREMAATGLAVDAAIRHGDKQNVLANAGALMTLVDRLIAEDVIALSPNRRGAVTVALQSIRGFIAIWQAVQTPAQAAVGTPLPGIISEAN